MLAVLVFFCLSSLDIFSNLKAPIGLSIYDFIPVVLLYKVFFLLSLSTLPALGVMIVLSIDNLKLGMFATDF